MSSGMILPATVSRGTNPFPRTSSFPTHAAKSATDRVFAAQVAQRMCRYPTKRRAVEMFGLFHHGQVRRSSSL